LHSCWPDFSCCGEGMIERNHSDEFFKGIL
jgi:hypothetical protein